MQRKFVFLLAVLSQFTLLGASQQGQDRIGAPAPPPHLAQNRNPRVLGTPAPPPHHTQDQNPRVLGTPAPPPHLAQNQNPRVLGTPAPQFNLQHWVNSPQLEISNLKNKVVLVRWWTDTCDMCAATAPALLQLQEEYGSQGFQVVGIFHPKPAGDWSVARLQRATSKFGFSFPVGFDGDWSALRRWWLDGAQRDYTSVSFLVDKHGIIRYVHPGGEFHPSNGSPEHQVCERDFKAIEKTIAELLAEK